MKKQGRTLCVLQEPHLNIKMYGGGIAKLCLAVAFQAPLSMYKVHVESKRM